MPIAQNKRTIEEASQKEDRQSVTPSYIRRDRSQTLTKADNGSPDNRGFTHTLPTSPYFSQNFQPSFRPPVSNQASFSQISKQASFGQISSLSNHSQISKPEKTKEQLEEEKKEQLKKEKKEKEQKMYEELPEWDIVTLSITK